jgi:hypothetical protein
MMNFHFPLILAKYKVCQYEHAQGKKPYISSKVVSPLCNDASQSNETYIKGMLYMYLN